MYLCFCILLKSRLDTISREIFVFVFLYFDQVWNGYQHLHNDFLYLYFCNLLKSWLNTLHRDCLYLYFCILLKSWLDTICTKIFFVFGFLCLPQVKIAYHVKSFFVFVFLYFAQVQIGCHIQRDFSYLYFCILTKSGMDTICTKILCICISVICSSQNWIPFTIYLYFCILLKSWLANTTIPHTYCTGILCICFFVIFSKPDLWTTLYHMQRKSEAHYETSNSDFYRTQVRS